MPSVLTSVIVVRMILEAFAGSVPILRRTIGIVEPKMPLIKQRTRNHNLVKFLTRLCQQHLSHRDHTDEMLVFDRQQRGR